MHTQQPQRDQVYGKMIVKGFLTTGHNFFCNFFSGGLGYTLAAASFAFVDCICHSVIWWPDLYSGNLYSGNLCSGNLYSGNLYSGNLYSGNLYSGNLYSGNLCSGNLYSGNLYSGNLYSGNSFGFYLIKKLFSQISKIL